MKTYLSAKANELNTLATRLGLVVFLNRYTHEFNLCNSDGTIIECSKSSIFVQRKLNLIRRQLELAREQFSTRGAI